MSNPETRPSRTARANPVTISFEFFPPRTPKAMETLKTHAARLATLDPEFVSVTYGAGGSTRDVTREVLRALNAGGALPVAGHLTCVGATREEVDAVIEEYAADGIRHIVALRGDPQTGIGSRYRPHPGGYENAADLVAGIARRGGFDITVSAYPEKHPESADWGVDIDMLKAKVDAGASRAITQFFFDNDLYEAYVERVRAAGITIPIIPGILPIMNFEQMMVFATKCGASVPDWLTRRFVGLQEDPETRKLVASAAMVEQVLDLVDRGVEDFHFYTMNKADLVYAACHVLGRQPAESKREVA